MPTTTKSNRRTATIAKTIHVTACAYNAAGECVAQRQFFAADRDELMGIFAALAVGQCSHPDPKFRVVRTTFDLQLPR